MKPADASGMIALSYGITYIWGTVGIILICKYLPRWWGVDAKAAAKEYEAKFGVRDLEGAALTGYRQFGLRAYRLENSAKAGKSIAEFRTDNPEYRIVNVFRGDEQLGAEPSVVMRKGDIIALGGATAALTDKMGLIGPEVADPRAEHSARSGGNPRHQQGDGRQGSGEFRHAKLRGSSVVRYERGGVPFPAGLKTELQRMDIISVVGLKPAVEEVVDSWAVSREPIPRPTS